MRVAVTCGYGKSLHAIALIHELARRGHEVALTLEVSVWSVARLRSYLRQIGVRKLWSKVRAKLFAGRGGSVHAGEVLPMLEYVREHGITSRSVAAATGSVGGRHKRVKNLNGLDALDALHVADVDVITYAGGGILRRPLIDLPRHGVLNAHGGPLPAFRGMNAAEWALFHGVRPTVTTHFIDAGVDTGPLLFERDIPAESWREIALGRGTATRVSVESLLEAVDRLAAGALDSKPQPPGTGRQFFVMADPLLEVLERWIAEGRTPCLTPDEFSFEAMQTEQAEKSV